MPATRDPGAVVDHAQRAQRFDQRRLAPVEVAEVAVAARSIRRAASASSCGRRRAASTSPAPPGRCTRRRGRRNAVPWRSTAGCRDGNRRAAAACAAPACSKRTIDPLERHVTDGSPALRPPPARRRHGGRRWRCAPARRRSRHRASCGVRTAVGRRCMHATDEAADPPQRLRIVELRRTSCVTPRDRETIAVPASHRASQRWRLAEQPQCRCGVAAQQRSGAANGTSAVVSSAANACSSRICASLQRPGR